VLRAQHQFETDVELIPSGTSHAGFSLRLSGLELARADSDNIVMQSVQDVIAGLRSVDLDAGLVIEGGEVSIERFSTSADEALREGIGSTLAEQRDRYIARARDELEERIEERIGALEPQLSQASALLDRAEELQNTLENRDELIARTREELTRRSRELAESQRERVEDRAREEIEKRTEDLDLDDFGF
jgi:chromosome segregation ATPase